MLASALTFVVMMTLVKYLGSTYSTPVETFFRQLVMSIVVLPVIVRQGGAAFATSRPIMLLMRSLLAVVAMILSFYSYNKLTLATANTLSFTRGLWLVPLAVLALRERVGAVRIGALVVGFVGVVVMLRTSTGGLLDPAALAGLAAAALFAITITGMKSLTRDHTVTVIVCWSAIAGLVFSFPIAMFSWKWPTLKDTGLIVIMGVLAVLNQGFYAKGMQAGDALVMAPVDYTRLIFSTFLGAAIFHERVDVASYVGAAMIIGATAAVSWREYVQTHRARVATL